MRRPITGTGSWAWAGTALLLALPGLPGLWSSPWPSAAWAWALHPSAGLHQDPLNFWTCAWVHANPRHLLANLAGLGLVLGLGWLLQLSPRAALAWFLAWPLTHLALLLDPRLDTYFGLSGVLHAAMGIIATSLILQTAGNAWVRPAGWALLIGLLAKCWHENPHWLALVPRPDLGMNAAPMAHWAGVLIGTALTLVLTKCHRCAKSRP